MTNISLMILALSLLVQGTHEIDRLCFPAGCQSLIVSNGEVHFVEGGALSRDSLLGSYVSADQRLVPPAEVPIRDLRSKRGWHIVISAFLDHNERDVRLRVRFLDRNSRLQTTDEILMSLENAELGNLFGGNHEILALTSNEEHAYNAHTGVWLLPDEGKPKQLLDFIGRIADFVKFSTQNTGGLRINRETYDGVHPETKGYKTEFWTWDEQRNTLSLARDEDRR